MKTHTNENYLKFRGKCKELSEELCANNPNLTLVRGYYFCPIWNSEEQHWWCKDKTGKIIDPSKDQFPSRGLGFYREFDGTLECSNCGKSMLESEAMFDSNYAFCSTACNMRFVGL